MTWASWFRAWIRFLLPRLHSRRRREWKLTYPCGIITTPDGIGVAYPMVVLVAPCGQRWEGGARLPAPLRSISPPCPN